MKIAALSACLCVNLLNLWVIFTFGKDLMPVDAMLVYILVQSLVKVWWPVEFEVQASEWYALIWCPEWCRV